MLGTDVLDLLPAYAHPMRCRVRPPSAVLTSCPALPESVFALGAYLQRLPRGSSQVPIALRARYAMSGTDLAYRGITLRACRAMSGTDLAYCAFAYGAATPCLVLPSRTLLSPYALATPYPVLTLGYGATNLRRLLAPLRSCPSSLPPSEPSSYAPARRCPAMVQRQRASSPLRAI
eukprot:1270175-Rhodomonas_salina.2